MSAVRLELALFNGPIGFWMDDCDGLDHIVALSRTHGLAGYEAPYTSLIAEIVNEIPGDMLDIGANTGIYTLLGASSRADIRVHAFEPLGSIAERLSANIALNPDLAARIEIHRFALSERDGSSIFYERINPYGLFSTSSGLDASHDTSFQTRYNLVETLSLDTFARAASLSQVAFIKVDVEGHESRVLAGGADLVAQARPTIGVELLGDGDFTFFRSFLNENDYVDIAMKGSSLEFSRDPRFVLDGWNHLLAPTEQLGRLASIAARLGLSFNKS